MSSLARAFLAGDASVEDIVARAGKMLGRPWRWLRPTAQRYVEAYGDSTRPRHRDVVAFLLKDQSFQRAWKKRSDELRIVERVSGPGKFHPVAAAERWKIPAIESTRELGEWLRLSPDELLWFSDLKTINSKQDVPRLRHYHYRILAKSFNRIRLIEAPKQFLKQVQRKVLTEILNNIPMHPAAHGFARGRSIRTFATPHVGKRAVLRMDLEDFFPSIGRARIQAFFRTAGYPESVADLLGGICTHAAPREIWRNAGAEVDPSRLREAQSLYSRPHLPQGGPASPALANLCAYRVDCRLSGLAQCAGAAYTRYADDLAFSGDEAFSRRAERFATSVSAILLEEGFHVNHHKTRIMRQGGRQHLAGLVTNQRINFPRCEFDRLKALLTNCARHGPESQNHSGLPSFRLHVEGRVAFVESINREKGARLRRILDRIDWTGPADQASG